jgi:toxin ParE1/3/4
VRLDFHPEALLEFEEAVRFYNERGRDLGRRFAREVRLTTGKIEATPERWRVIEGDVRRCSVRVFPYAVLYTVERDSILILAIMHTRRQLGYWRRRLSN